MSTIELQNVSIRFDGGRDPVQTRNRPPRLPEDNIDMGKGVAALDHLSLTIPDGQTYVVVGPSGCGKSTLLRVISGLETNYSGHVLYDGVDVTNILPKDRYIGLVFQSYALYPHIESKGNLGFFFRIHKIDDKETEERIRITSELMGIGFRELLPRRPGKLSGGEKQRVAIARALVRQPRLLLLDEPLSNLDAKLRVKTRIEIKKLLRQFNITTIYVTHDQVEAAALADQVVVMRSGKIEQIGSYLDLTELPATTFVASFIGFPPMNLFPGGKVINSELNIEHLHIHLPESIRSLVKKEQAITFGIRPEAVRLDAGDGIRNEIKLTGQVELVEPDYGRHILQVRIRTGEWTYSASCSTEANYSIGDSVTAYLDPERLHFFDTLSGLRL